MPAAAIYMEMGEPRPPAPMHSTLVPLIFFWPAKPTSGRIRCREYRRISSLFNSIIKLHKVWQKRNKSSHATRIAHFGAVGALVCDAWPGPAVAGRLFRPD